MSVFGECICESCVRRRDVSGFSTPTVARRARRSRRVRNSTTSEDFRFRSKTGKRERERSAFVFCSRFALISDARGDSAFARSESLRLTSSGLSNNPPPGTPYPCDDKTGKCTFPPSSTGVHFWSKKWEIPGRPEQVNLKSRSRFPHLNSKEIPV